MRGTKRSRGSSRTWVLAGLGLIVGSLVFFHYDYIWRMPFTYWLSRQVGRFLSFIGVGG